MAFVAERHLQEGDSAAAWQQIRLICEQVRASHRTVDALLQLARALQQESERRKVDLDVLAKSAAQEAQVAVSTSSRLKVLPTIRLEPLGDT